MSKSINRQGVSPREDDSPTYLGYIYVFFPSAHLAKRRILRTCLNSVATNDIPVWGGGHCPDMGPGPLFQRVFQAKYEIPPSLRLTMYAQTWECTDFGSLFALILVRSQCPDFGSLLALILARSQCPVAVCCEDSTRTGAEQNNIPPSLLLVGRFPLGGSHFDTSFYVSHPVLTSNGEEERNH